MLSDVLSWCLGSKSSRLTSDNIRILSAYVAAVRVPTMRPYRATDRSIVNGCREEGDGESAGGRVGM